MIPYMYGVVSVDRAETPQPEPVFKTIAKSAVKI